MRVVIGRRHLAGVKAAVGVGIRDIAGSKRFLKGGTAKEILGPIAVFILGQGEGPRVVHERPRAYVLLRKREHSPGAHGVAGGQTAGDDAFVLPGFENPVPNIHDLVVGNEDFKALLAGIPRTGQEDRRTVGKENIAVGKFDVALEGEIGQFVEHGLGVLEKLGHDADRSRALKVELAVRPSEIADRYALAFGNGPCAERFGNAFALAHIEHHKVTAFAQGVYDGVIHHAAGRIEERAVSGTRTGQGQILGKGPLKRFQRVGAGNHEPGHMPDIEQSGVLDDGEMFLHRAGGIPERHIPTAEINQRGAEGLMRCV